MSGAPSCRKSRRRTRGPRSLLGISSIGWDIDSGSIAVTFPEETPDLVLPKHRAVTFAHGCLWHQNTRQGPADTGFELVPYNK